MDCKTVLTFASASELRRGLEADRVMPRPVSGTLLWSWLEPVSPAEPRVTELPAFLSDVLQEPGASVVGGLFRSYSGTGNPQHLYCCEWMRDDQPPLPSLSGSQQNSVTWR